MSVSPMCATHVHQMKRRRYPPLGSIVELDLGADGKFYGRVLKDACVGWYSAPEPPERGNYDYAFVVGMYRDAVPDLRPVRRDEGVDPNDDWPLPQKIVEPIIGRHKIYDRGEIRPSTASEASELETAAVWDIEQIAPRLRELRHRTS